MNFVFAKGVLTIQGDSWENSARVSVANNRVNVRVESVPTNGFVLTPSIKTGSFQDVEKIRFFGEQGNDSFESTSTIPCELNGDTGNDTLRGGRGNDFIRGGAGNDLIYGLDGDDTLYGDAGNDSIYGGNGLDGLYGGEGSDNLFGGADADRFLIMDKSSEARDATAADARVIFKNDKRTWSSSEIIDIDKGLIQLHLHTRNDNLLEQKNGTSFTFWRGGANAVASGSTKSDGRINIFDGAFVGSSDEAAHVAIHEIGHHWDNEHSGWNDWQKLSGWVNSRPSAAQLPRYTKGIDKDENWWYLNTATFVSTYAKTNPREEFAEAFLSFFISESLGTDHALKFPADLKPLSNAKFSHLADLVYGLG